jgi:hypothetical protein
MRPLYIAPQIAIAMEVLPALTDQPGRNRMLSIFRPFVFANRLR